jgi:hypothetical protein
MERLDWALGDLCYAGFLIGTLILGYSATGYRLLMVGFVAAIGVTDWIESRRRGKLHAPQMVTVTALSLLILFGCLTVPETRLAVYFAGLSAVFLLQAIRHVLVYEPNPAVLFRQGYPSLVGLSIVCSALADGLVQFRRTLLVLLAAVFLFRKLYARW